MSCTVKTARASSGVIKVSSRWPVTWLKFMASVWDCNWNNGVRDKLGNPICQEIDDCWAVAPTRQFEMQLKMMKNHMADDEKLSIQEVINMMPRCYLDMEDPEGGGLDDLGMCAEMLKKQLKPLKTCLIWWLRLSMNST
ncbi:unnamed protein product [Microthlaspi erraticum]|uniref:Uncharacterized protein n=1 Tax=Microthlaspi erraticum TaxID=1685480 RepID=A0A6D2IN17_9BRAS|nr:unnamed protein product [Microthlaspi erraticum]